MSPQPLHAAVDVPNPPSPLRVADGPPVGGGREVTVDATVPRTSLGRFSPGDHVHVRVVGGEWRNAPGSPFIGATGYSGNCHGEPGHPCAAGQDAAPGMGLVLLATPVTPPRAACTPSQRLFVPRGVEFSMPNNAFLFLAPNDWEDGLYNNSGAIEAQVELSSSKAAPAFARRSITVDSRSPRTPLGQVSAGTYLRVNVLSGTWTHDPGAPPVGPDGGKNPVCSSSGTSHACAGGEGRGPTMALVLLMASCDDGGIAPPAPVERRYIPKGVDFTVESDSELFLAPNDWEDACGDNSGSIRVEIVVEHAR